MKKKISILLLVIVIIIVSVIGCAAGSEKNDSSSENGVAAQYTEYEDMSVLEPDYEPMEAPPNAGGGGDNYSPDPSSFTPIKEGMEQKLVYTTNLSLESMNYEKDTVGIPELVKKHQGYIQSSNVQGSSLEGSYNRRYANFSIRIPSENSAAFEAELRENFNVAGTSQYVQDITQDYYNIASQLKSLEERLVALEGYLEQAEDLEVLLQVEREINSTKQQIEYLHQQLEYYETQISFDTFEISITEVIQYSATPVDNSFGARIRTAGKNAVSTFVNTIQNLIIAIVENALFILIVLAIFILIFVRVRSFRKKEKTSLKNEKKSRVK